MVWPVISTSTPGGDSMLGVSVRTSQTFAAWVATSVINLYDADLRKVQGQIFAGDGRALTFRLSTSCDRNRGPHLMATQRAGRLRDNRRDTELRSGARKAVPTRGSAQLLDLNHILSG